MYRQLPEDCLFGTTPSSVPRTGAARISRAIRPQRLRIFGFTGVELPIARPNHAGPYHCAVAGASSANSCPAQAPAGPRVPTLVHMVFVNMFFNQFVRWGHKRYGSAFSTRFVSPGQGSEPLVMLSKADDLRQVLSGSGSTFRAGENNSHLGGVVGTSSVLVLDGAEHARMRKLLTPSFIGGSLRGYESMMSDIAEAAVDLWPTNIDFSVIEKTQELTLDIIIRVVFGVQDSERAETLKPPIKTVLNVTAGAVLSVYYPALRRLGLGRDFHRARNELECFLAAEVAACRANPENERREDVCSRLARTVVDGEHLSDTEAVDQLITLLLAGHETTSTALAWCLHELARQPEVQARAQQAADEDDLAYLTAVLQEAMRVHPPVTGIGRKLGERTTIGGHRLEAGTRVAFAGTIVHNDAEHHCNPHQFSPERFLTEKPPAGDVYFPFGGGIRRCIGASFALAEGSRVLLAVLKRFQIASGTSPEREVTKFVTITAPARGGRVRLSLR